MSNFPSSEFPRMGGGGFLGAIFLKWIFSGAVLTGSFSGGQ